MRGRRRSRERRPGGQQPSQPARPAGRHRSGPEGDPKPAAEGGRREIAAPDEPHAPPNTRADKRRGQTGTTDSRNARMSGRPAGTKSAQGRTARPERNGIPRTGARKPRERSEAGQTNTKDRGRTSRFQGCKQGDKCLRWLSCRPGSLAAKPLLAAGTARQRVRSAMNVSNRGRWKEQRRNTDACMQGRWNGFHEVGRHVDQAFGVRLPKMAGQRRDDHRTSHGRSGKEGQADAGGDARRG